MLFASAHYFQNEIQGYSGSDKSALWSDFLPTSGGCPRHYIAQRICSSNLFVLRWVLESSLPARFLVSVFGVPPCCPDNCSNPSEHAVPLNLTSHISRELDIALPICCNGVQWKSGGVVVSRYVR